MAHIEVCLFSPFSPHLARQEHYRALLLQFFLKELFAAHQATLCDAPVQLIISLERRHFPYDWAKESGHINKAHEHAQLLQIAFTSSQETVANINEILTDLILKFAGTDHFTSQNKRLMKKKLRQLYLLTEPLIIQCQNNENLIFFLLKHKDAIHALVRNRHLLFFLSQLYCAGSDLLDSRQSQKELRQLEKKLSDHYHERGFFSLIPELQQLFAELSL